MEIWLSATCGHGLHRSSVIDARTLSEEDGVFTRHLGRVAEVQRRHLRLVRTDLERVDQVADEALYGEESVVTSASGRVENDRQVDLTAAGCVNQSRKRHITN